MAAGVWGAGAEGQSAARALLGEGTDVIVVDESGRPRPQQLDPRADFATGDRALDLLLECSFVVISPGVPRTHRFRARLAEAGISITSLTERWMSRAADATIGVTGTKGKSTTTTLIGLLLEAAGVDTQLGGNIGVPLAELRLDVDATVAELSSYQCASLSRAPRIAVITSLYEDHLTWHGSKLAYWQDKARIAGDGCEVLVCDEQTLGALRSIGAELPRRVIRPDDAARTRITALALPETLRLRQNLHNLELAVLAADQWLCRPVSEREILDASARFHPLPHRLQQVAAREGVTWIDDTLATVPESVIAASEAFPGEIVLIVGGEDRGVSYRGLTEHLKGREPLPHVIVMPSNGERIVADYQLAHPQLVHHAATLSEAVRSAAAVARPGATVVLSPGAPSYDHFRSFEHKSAVYVEAIRALDDPGPPWRSAES